MSLTRCIRCTREVEPVEGFSRLDGYRLCRTCFEQGFFLERCDGDEPWLIAPTGKEVATCDQLSHRRLMLQDERTRVVV